MEIRKLQRMIQQEEPHTAEKEAIQREYITTIENFKKVKKSVLELKKALKVSQCSRWLRWDTVWCACGVVCVVLIEGVL